MGHDLYETDFEAWARQQADALRRLGPVSNVLDLENLVEEVEDLGNSERRAVHRFIALIMLHLVKHAFGDPEAHRGLEAEIDAFQAQLRSTYRPSMAQRIDVEECWTIASTQAIRFMNGLATADRDVPSLPMTSPFTLAALLDPTTPIADLVARIRAKSHLEGQDTDPPAPTRG